MKPPQTTRLTHGLDHFTHDYCNVPCCFIAEGQTAKEDGDEGGEKEAFGTVVYGDPPVLYTRKRGTKKDSAEPGEGQSKR